jgi:GNAT superfamily N-acetyltransferase
MNVQIERVNEQNVEQWIYLLDGLAGFEHRPPLETAAKKRLKADALVPTPRFEAYLGALDGEAIGCLTLLSTYSTFRASPVLYIEDIFVLEAYRRRGVGQVLFDFCVRLARERQCAGLEWTVLKWNEPAIRFYDKNKGVPISDWVWYRRDLHA